jgi:hypothetical protein
MIGIKMKNIYKVYLKLVMLQETARLKVFLLLNPLVLMQLKQLKKLKKQVLKIIKILFMIVLSLLKQSKKE